MNIDDMTQTENALQPMPVSQLGVTQYDGMIKVAQLMAKAKQSLPKHLHDNPGDCLAIVMMSLQWRLNPWMVGQKTSIISNRLMYEGQLVAAIINNSGMLAKRFRYEFSGQDNNRICKCIGMLKGEEQERDIEVGMPNGGQAKNSPLWAGSQADKDQQLSYKAARVWVRRHAPEVLLGVYTPDDDWNDGNTIDGQTIVENQQDAFTMQALENKPAQNVDFSQLGAKQKEPVTLDQDKPTPTVSSPQKETTTAVRTRKPIEKKPEPEKPKDEWADLASGVDKPKTKQPDLLDAPAKGCATCGGKGSVPFKETDSETGEIYEGIEPCPTCQEQPE